MKKIILVMLALIIIISMNYLHAGWPVNKTPMIEGKVIDMLTNEPIENVTIEVKHESTVFFPPTENTWRIYTNTVTVTGKDGVFRIPSITSIKIFSLFHRLRLIFSHPLYEYKEAICTTGANILKKNFYGYVWTLDDRAPETYADIEPIVKPIKQTMMIGHGKWKNKFIETEDNRIYNELGKEIERYFFKKNGKIQCEIRLLSHIQLRKDLFHKLNPEELRAFDNYEKLMLSATPKEIIMTVKFRDELRSAVNYDKLSKSFRRIIDLNFHYGFYPVSKGRLP